MSAGADGVAQNVPMVTGGQLCVSSGDVCVRRMRMFLSLTHRRGV